MLERLARIVVAAAAVVLAVPLAGARAQDDWSITRPSGGHARPGGRPRPGGGAARPHAPRPETPPTTDATTARRDALIARYTRILDANPAEAFALTRLLDLYRERDGNIDGFVRDLTGRADADARAYAPRLLLGRILASQGRLDDARARYSEARALAPADAAPIVAMAELERGAGRAAEAGRLYDAAVALVRDANARADLVRSAAEAALDAGDFDGAARRYGELARGRGTSVFIASEYAHALLARHEWARAVEELRRVLARMAGDNRVVAPILRDLARAELETGAVDEAIQTLERALRVAADEGIRRDIREVLVDAYRRADRLPELVR